MTVRPETSSRAHVQNPLVAEVRSFQPGFAARPLRQNHLNVRNAPGSRHDAVVRALQRYLDVKPRRQPSADPRDEASVARHPQGLLEAGSRWAQDVFYQFTDNGATNYQLRPDYRLWGGTLELELKGAGRTSVSAPATGAGAEASGAAAPAEAGKFGYDPANAAQETQARMNEILAARQGASREAVKVGPPTMNDNPYFDPAFAAQNAIKKMRADLAGENRAASPRDIQAGLDRAQRIRDAFFRSGPVLDSQNI
jgi:hypothetical protein